jgi:DNA-directed RNA polymerase specialized sigma subunit
MPTSSEKIRAQKLTSYYKAQARKKETDAENTRQKFLTLFPKWEQDKLLIDEKYRIVLEGYYALGTAKLSLQMIGTELGISKQAVQELRDKGLRDLTRLAEYPKLRQERFEIYLKKLAAENLLLAENL